MAGITSYLAILTLTVNGLNSPMENTVWKTRIKRKIQQSAVYRRPISSTETSIGLG
jgi:hypothetical protein